MFKYWSKWHRRESLMLWVNTVFCISLAVEKYINFATLHFFLYKKTKYLFAVVCEVRMKLYIYPLHHQMSTIKSIEFIVFLYWSDFWIQMEIDWFVNSLRWPVCYEWVDADETEVWWHWRSSCRKTGGNLPNVLTWSMQISHFEHKSCCSTPFQNLYIWEELNWTQAL